VKQGRSNNARKRGGTEEKSEGDRYAAHVRSPSKFSGVVASMLAGVTS